MAHKQKKIMSAPYLMPKKANTLASKMKGSGHTHN
jgi:hypothetical protein